jgi:hypothetical protein
LVTDKEYVDAAFIQFAEAWAGAACATRGKRQSGRRSAQRGLVPYSELARFFDNFHMLIAAARGRTKITGSGGRYPGWPLTIAPLQLRRAQLESLNLVS